jgi:hypothetical protein
MPRRLLDRCRPDSIFEFSCAAQQRFQDGLSLAPAGRRTAAIYLWGYAAEMTLKAAYFRLIGFPLAQAITIADLRAARVNALLLGFQWAGNNLHHLESWAQLIVSTRAATPGWAYLVAGFGNEVLARSRTLQPLWSETLRYHKNVAYPYEVGQARTAAEWLLLNASQL